MWRGVLLLLGVALSIQAANIYQECGAWSGSQVYTLDPLVKNITDTPYSYQLNSSHTLHYNFCAGTSKCNGAMMCLEGPHGLTIIASPGDGGNSYYNGNGIVTSYNPPGTFISQTFTCEPSQTAPVVVSNVYYDDEDHDTVMYIHTPLVCQGQPMAIRQPWSRDHISGQIYMVGTMPMWAFDWVASADGQAAFEGYFYYSAPALSFKLNGTLSNSQGQKSSVEMIVSGRQTLGNPATSVTIFQPSSGKTTCNLLPTPKSSYSLEWFSLDANSKSLIRTYESIYWNKGATFNVTEYFHAPYYSLMQSNSAGSPTVALGQYFLAPFVDASHNSFVTEVEWDSLDYNRLPASTFEIPTPCKQ